MIREKHNTRGTKQIISIKWQKYLGLEEVQENETEKKRKC